jgi:hypothetical protein
MKKKFKILDPDNEINDNDFNELIIPIDKPEKNIIEELSNDKNLNLHNGKINDNEIEETLNLKNSVNIDQKEQNKENNSYNYEKDKYRKKIFNETLEIKSVDQSEGEKKKPKKFKDFLELPKSSGHRKNMSNTNCYSADTIIDDGSSIEIVDEFGEELARRPDTTKIITNKNSDGEIESIEVICGCGNRTVIKLDIEEPKPD